MTAFVLLAAAAVTADNAQQTWVDQLREADRLRGKAQYGEAEQAYIVKRKQAEILGADELPMAITLNHLGYLGSDYRPASGGGEGQRPNRNYELRCTTCAARKISPVFNTSRLFPTFTPAHLD